ncbi:MAG: hypothetical protein JXB47_16865 [Anaerolineae bacterium]|nr:hypothetical protein [Anaerolineae bacterium]
MRQSVKEAVDALLRGAVTHIMAGADGSAALNPTVARGNGILPGSFNPLHRGHCAIADAAVKRLGAPVFFELSVTNVDKPPLDAGTVLARLAQFAGKPRAVLLTCAPLYHEKAALFPGCVFVVGYDTAERLFMPRYYGGSDTAVYRSLRAIMAAECRFLVAGRADDAGVFRTAADLRAPDDFRPYLEGIPEDEFRMDISSTTLRTQTP